MHIVPHKEERMNISMTCTDMTKLREKAPVIFRGPWEECFSKIASLGYDGAEVHIHDSSCIDRKELKRKLDQAGLKLTSIGTGTAYGWDHLSLTSADGYVRQQAVDRLKEHILTAADYDHAVVIVGLIRGKVAECEGRAEYEARLLAGLKECADYGARYGVVLGVELLNRYECDYANNIDEGLEMLDQVGSPNLQLHLDTYHMNIEEGDIRKAILKAAGRIGHVHIADNDRWYAGHGHYDFKETVEALREAGYDYALAVESLYYPDPETSASHTYEVLKNLI